MLDTNTSSPTFQSSKGDGIGQGATPRPINSKDLRSMLSRAADENINDFRFKMASKMRTATDSLKAHVDRSTDQSANEMKDVLERFYSLGLQGGENLMNRLTEPFELLEGALCSLLERDQYALDYFRMKFEIVELKKKLGIRDPSILNYLH